MIQINNNLRYRYCPLCGAVNIYKLGNINYFSPVYYSTEQVLMLSVPELWNCRICYSAFVQNAVPEAESVSLYRRGESAKRWSDNLTFEQSKTKLAVRSLEKLLKRDIRVLDVGCNTGELLDFAKERGCKTFGVEYSSLSLSLLEKKGHTAYSNIKEIDSSFDIITAFDLVEHLYNVPEFLDICFDRLSSGGYLVFLTGNISCFWKRLTGAKWWYTRYPEHIIFPSKKYFELQAKFQLIEWIPTYASPSYQQPILRALKSITKALLVGNYAGKPALSPDHAFIVLKRKTLGEAVLEHQMVK